MRAKPPFLPLPHLFPLLAPIVLPLFFWHASNFCQIWAKAGSSFAAGVPGMSEPPLFPLFSHRCSEPASRIDWRMTCLAGLRHSDRRFPRVLLLMEFAAGAKSCIQITLPSPRFLPPFFLSAIQREEGEENGTWIK